MKRIGYLLFITLWTRIVFGQEIDSLGINNNGTLGTGFAASSLYDYYTGQTVQSSNYPSNSYLSYLFGGSLWVGAIVGRDTLVSVGSTGWTQGQEFHPDEIPFGYTQYRSTISDDPAISTDAVSEEDYIAVYYDTLTEGVPNDYFGRPHVPMNLEITQSSYSWAYPHTEDFIIINYKIKNIGSTTLNQVYVGILMDKDVGSLTGQYANSRHTDDLAGFLPEYEFNFQNCQYTEQMDIAWIADNDGDPTGGLYDGNSVQSVVGMKILEPVFEQSQTSYNWYVSNGYAQYDFGPRERSGVGTWQEEYRDFGTGGTGTPSGDANKYYLMRNKEIDYDQIYTASIEPTDPLWMYPNNQALANTMSTGSDTRYLLSVGPIDQLEPNETYNFTVAYVGGEYFHTNPSAINNLPDNPEMYYDQLDFTDLAYNARWADWVFDNPGVDTDGDGYYGEYIVCNNDTSWIKGDGVPDFQAAGSPEPPQARYESDGEQMTIRWNGLNSETKPDFLSRRIDFEGYNVYLQNGNNEPYEKFASYDQENYFKYTWAYGSWSLRDYPFTIEELRCLYADSCDDITFDPLNYTETTPYIHPQFPESLFYFAPVGENNSELGISTPIVKIYPDQPYPTSLNPEEALPSELTSDGFLKYFEYMLEVDLNQDYVIPSMCYRASVTAFDYGSHIVNIPPQESKKERTEFYGCIEVKSTIVPDTIYAYMANAIDPITGIVTLGFDGNGIQGKELNHNSFGFDFPFDSIKVLDNIDGFAGDATVMYFSVKDYIQDISPFFDTTVYNESKIGNYIDGQETFTQFNYVLIGHRSGDLNADGAIDIADLVFFVEYMFNNGSPPQVLGSADLNHDDVIDIGDLVEMIEMMF